MVLGRFKVNFSKAPMGLMYKINIGLIIVMLVVAVGLFFVNNASAAGLTLNTTLPAKNFNVPSGSLSKVLATYSAQAGVVLVFDPILTDGKISDGIHGRFDVSDGFATLLKGTELAVVGDTNGEYTLKRNPKIVDDSKNLPDQISLKETVVRSQRFYEVGPLPGLGLTLDQIPGNVQSISAKEIKESRSLSLTDLMNRKLQSVNVNDYQGNPFQMDITYRGFTAGPQIGTPQGLSVFFDGIRVNEPFGDVVNWDMIPMNALAGVDVFPGSNPIFGLNTLGGAFAMKTKDGFNNAGVDADILTGSFGRKQLQVSGGWNNGTVGLFGAGNFFLEDGWRQNSPSRVNQVFGKASYRGEKLDLNLSTLLVQTELVGNGLFPSEMYKQDRNGTFTAPDTTNNDLGQLQLSSSYFVSDTFTITGQVYRRNSKRHSVGADAFTGIKDDTLAHRKFNDGEQYTCLFNSTTTGPNANRYGIPDYYVIPVEADPVGGADLFGNADFSAYLGGTPLPDSFKNQELSPEFAESFKYQYDTFKNDYATLVYNRNNPVVNDNGPTTNFSFGTDALYRTGGLFPQGKFLEVPGAQVYNDFGQIYFYSTKTTTDPITNVVSTAVIKNFVFITLPVNNDNCLATKAIDVAGNSQRAGSYYYPGTNTIATVDGAGSGTPGIVDGTPTSLITDNKIDQIVNGASMQLNWNLEHHKFMVGLAIDAADAKYTNSQRLGLLDANRNAYLAPDLINPIFTGADVDISNNDFSGTNITKSVYFSETWTPVKAWNFSASGRYNETRAKNKIAARYGNAAYEIGDVLSYPNGYDTCTNGNCANVPTGYTAPKITNALNAPETEKFSYYSFNPSLGVTWQALENINLYVNLAQGTRTPSVIELGCALDKTPSGLRYADSQGNMYDVPKSVAENRSCTLPTTLSGDPYLPQIRATTYDLGLRGTIGESMKWNLGAYQTDLKDDIYFVAAGNGRGFFDSIGDTRRRGIEAGISGKVDKSRFSLNYSLTDATFQNDFQMFSADNSSAVSIDQLGTGVINVKPDSRMPGVPLHNLNASFSYDFTDRWTVGLSAVMHSESFLRGNENNEHRVGVSRTFNSIRQVSDGAGGSMAEVFERTLPATSNPGKVSGYATFNLQTSYKLTTEWTATMLVNNLFDREYFTAGRLGRNPFSPSILGAIGPDGYNHNSDDWRSTNFIAPSAPRGIWFSLNYQFDAKK